MGQRRRRSSNADPLKKMSIRMRESVATAIREFGESGAAPSADAFIEAAVVARFREQRKQRVYAGYAAAAADAHFMSELDATNRAFEASAADGLPEAER